MTMNTAHTVATPSEETTGEGWLLAHINAEVDWSNPFKQEEFGLLQAWVADATMQPIDNITVDMGTDGGRLYNKLRIQAKEERRDEIQQEIGLIRYTKYSHLNREKGNALAALDYARQAHKGRASFQQTGPTGAVFYASTETRLARALDAHARFRKRVRYSLSKTTYR